MFFSFGRSSTENITDQILSKKSKRKLLLSMSSKRCGSATSRAVIIEVTKKKVEHSFLQFNNAVIGELELSLQMPTVPTTYEKDDSNLHKESFSKS